MTVINEQIETAPLLGVGEAAERLGIPRRVLSVYLYARDVPHEVCPLIGGRRAVPTAYLPTLAQELRRAGYDVAG